MDGISLLIAAIAWAGGVLCATLVMSYTRRKYADAMLLSVGTTVLGVATLYLIAGV